MPIELLIFFVPILALLTQFDTKRAHFYDDGFLTVHAFPFFHSASANRLIAINDVALAVWDVNRIASAVKPKLNCLFRYVKEFHIIHSRLPSHANVLHRV